MLMRACVFMMRMHGWQTRARVRVERKRFVSRSDGEKSQPLNI